MKSEELVTEHIVVTRKIWILLWDLRVKWKQKRLSDVIKILIYGETGKCIGVGHSL